MEINIIVSLVAGAAGGGGLAYVAFKTYLLDTIKAQIKYQFDVKLEAAKLGIKHEYELRFESAKSGIKHEYDLKFESARKELERKATEHQIQYSKLHIDRSERLKEIYHKLLEGEHSLQNLTTIFQGPEWVNDKDREKNALDRLQELNSLILNNRIYFPSDLCEKLDKVALDYAKVIQEMGNAKYLAEQESRTGRRIEEYDSPLKMWMQQRDYVSKEFVALRKSIEEEFRRILGVLD